MTINWRQDKGLSCSGPDQSTPSDSGILRPGCKGRSSKTDCEAEGQVPTAGSLARPRAPSARSRTSCPTILSNHLCALRTPSLPFAYPDGAAWSGDPQGAPTSLASLRGSGFLATPRERHLPLPRVKKGSSVLSRSSCTAMRPGSSLRTKSRRRDSAAVPVEPAEPGDVEAAAPAPAPAPVPAAAPARAPLQPMSLSRRAGSVDTVTVLSRHGLSGSREAAAVAPASSSGGGSRSRNSNSSGGGGGGGGPGLKPRLGRPRSPKPGPGLRRAPAAAMAGGAAVLRAVATVAKKEEEAAVETTDTEANQDARAKEPREPLASSPQLWAPPPDRSWTAPPRRLPAPRRRPPLHLLPWRTLSVLEAPPGLVHAPVAPSPFPGSPPMAPAQGSSASTPFSKILNT